MKVYKQNSSFDQAEAICLADKMHLLMIQNDEENVVTCMAINEMGMSDAWIGGRNVDGAPYHWTATSQQITYSGVWWLLRNSGNRNCVRIAGSEGTIRFCYWRSHQCDELAPFICQETEEDWIKRTGGLNRNTTEAPQKTTEVSIKTTEASLKPTEVSIRTTEDITTETFSEWEEDEEKEEKFFIWWWVLLGSVVGLSLLVISYVVFRFMTRFRGKVVIATLQAKVPLEDDSNCPYYEPVQYNTVNFY